MVFAQDNLNRLSRFMCVDGARALINYKIFYIFAISIGYLIECAKSNGLTPILSLQLGVNRACQII